MDVKALMEAFPAMWLKAPGFQEAFRDPRPATSQRPLHSPHCTLPASVLLRRRE